MPRWNITEATIGEYTLSGRKDRPWLIQVPTRRGSQILEDVSVTEEQFHFAEQYALARKRRDEACAARENFEPPPKEPPLEALEPQDRLTPRQALFCQHYAARPVATRAAMMAGYSTRSAASRGWKLLRHPLVLARLAEIRAERKLRYRIEPDTLHDKLEAIFFEALEAGSHAAAVAALRLQAVLGGLIEKPRAAPRSGGKGKDEGEKGKEGGIDEG